MFILYVPHSLLQRMLSNALQAETLEDLYEWKAALENALAQAPSTGHANGILKNDKIEPNNGSSEPCMLFHPVVFGDHLFYFISSS